MRNCARCWRPCNKNAAIDCIRVAGTRVPRAFYGLDALAPGDAVFLEGADGRRYAFEVYDRMTVEPDDTWVTYPVEGRTVVSLQTCVPIPTFENRLIVRAELVS